MYNLKLKDVDSKFLGTNSDVIWQIIQSTPLFYYEGTNKVLTVEEEYEVLIRLTQVTEKFIRKYQDKVYWKDISLYQILSGDFIREFQDRLDWDYISRNQKLSESFIREFKYKVYWYNISKYQKLSEDFIREFQDKVVWYCISEYQTLSESFIREFQDRLDFQFDKF